MTKQEFKTRKEKAVLMTRQNYLLSEIMNM